MYNLQCILGAYDMQAAHIQRRAAIHRMKMLILAMHRQPKLVARTDMARIR